MLQLPIRALELVWRARACMCVRVEGPCVPEEPDGPANSQGFVGEEVSLNTLSRYPRGRCVCLYERETGRKTNGVRVCLCVCV